MIDNSGHEYKARTQAERTYFRSLCAFIKAPRFSEGMQILQEFVDKGEDWLAEPALWTEAWYAQAGPIELLAKRTCNPLGLADYESLLYNCLYTETSSVTFIDSAVSALPGIMWARPRPTQTVRSFWLIQRRVCIPFEIYIYMICKYTHDLYLLVWSNLFLASSIPPLGQFFFAVLTSPMCYLASPFSGLRGDSQRGSSAVKCSVYCSCTQSHDGTKQHTYFW